MKLNIDMSLITLINYLLRPVCRVFSTKFFLITKNTDYLIINHLKSQVHHDSAS